MFITLKHLATLKFTPEFTDWKIFRYVNHELLKI